MSTGADGRTDATSNVRSLAAAGAALLAACAAGALGVVGAVCPIAAPTPSNIPTPRNNRRQLLTRMVIYNSPLHPGTASHADWFHERLPLFLFTYN
jgi:hypothetical protein